MSGLLARCSNCFSIAWPPTSRQQRSPLLRLSCLKNFAVCMASSRVGERTTARTPTETEWEPRRSMIGIRKAAVFPDPVRAMATTSWPSKMTGMVFRWIGVGTL